MLISQFHTEEAARSLKRLQELKIITLKEIVELQILLSKVQSDESLTKQQELNTTRRLIRQIDFLEKAVAQIPDASDSIFFNKSVEYGVTDEISLGCKAFYKSNLRFTKIFEFEVFNKLEIYKNKKTKISISPKVIFSQNKNAALEMRIIFLRSKKKKAFSLFQETQFGARKALFGIQYFTEITCGMKFNNGLLLYLQSFLCNEPKNPMLIYKSTVKNQFSIAKQMKNKAITLQASYYLQHSSRWKDHVAKGIVAGLWVEI